MNISNRENLLMKARSVKDKIEKLIQQGSLEEAKAGIDKYEKLIPNDVEIYSMKAVVLMMENRLEDAERILLDGLKLNGMDFDILYNLGYLYEQKNNTEMAARYYLHAQPLAVSMDQKSELGEAVERIKGLYGINLAKWKRVVFFLKKGMNSFFDDMMAELSKTHITHKVIVDELSLIDRWMEWGDIAWFDWCDDLAVYGSRLEIAREKKIVCRLHSYEAFTPYASNVNWANIDRVIFVAEHIRDFVLEQVKTLEAAKTAVIPNGIKLEKYCYSERKSGYNIAFVGYINYKKGPMLLLHTFKEIHSRNEKYKLYMAGRFQDPRYVLYFKQMIKELELENSVIFDGWQEDVDKWLEDKDYIISTSVLESQHLSIMEAMTKGIKPIIHNFVGAKQIYPEEYIWNTMDEAADMVISKHYDSKSYRRFIEENYSLDEQMKKINKLLNKVIEMEKCVQDKYGDIYEFAYKDEIIRFYLPYLNDHIQRIIYSTRNFYESGMLEDIRERTGDNSVIVDVGANIGNHTVYFGKVCKAKRVYAFEPQAKVFEILKKNVVINDLEDKVSLYKCALGREKGKADVMIANSNNLGMAQVQQKNNGDIDVETLDGVLLPEVDRVNVLKIDVEGMELDVLEGAKEIIQRFKPIIYIEADEEDKYNKLNEYLSTFGYTAKLRFNATPTYLFTCDRI